MAQYLTNAHHLNQKIMKKAFLFLTVTMVGLASAQERPLPQVNVNGEGIVKVVPDQAQLTVSIENKGANATDVKKQNDATVSKVVSAIKKLKLPEKDVMTRRVSLQHIYDSEKKKYTYFASQTITILLRDLDRYDQVMTALIDAGVNEIASVEFKYSKLEEAQTEARQKAMQNARKKADELASAIGQKAGRAISITDNDQPAYFPRQYALAAKGGGMADMEQATLAVGETEVKSHVMVSFYLE